MVTLVTVDTVVRGALVAAPGAGAGGSRPTAAARLRGLLPWLLAAAVACVGAVGIVTPSFGARLLGMCVLGWGLGRIVTRPMVGVYVTLWMLPWVRLARFALWIQNPNLPFFFISSIWLEILVGLALFGIVARATVHRERLPFDRDDLPLLLVLLSGGYGLLIAAEEHQYATAINGVSESLVPVLCYFVTRWLKPSALQVRKTCLTVLVLFVCLAVLSLADYVFHPAFMLHLEALARGNGAAFASFQGGTASLYHLVTTTYFRMESLLLDENTWGELCSCVALATLAGLTVGGVKRGAAAAGLGAVFGTAVFCLALSMSRGAILGFAAGLVVLGAVHRRRARVVKVALVVVLAAAAVFLALRAEPRIRQMEDRVQEALQWHGLDEVRAGQWDRGLETMTELPSGIGLFGTGPRGTSSSDCIYLRVLVDRGYPGALLWGIGTLGLGLALWRRFGAVRRRAAAAGAAGAPGTGEDLLLEALGLGLLAGYVSISVHGLSANSWDYYCVSPLFFLCCGLFMARAAGRGRMPAAGGASR